VLPERKEARLVRKVEGRRKDGHCYRKKGPERKERGRRTGAARKR
jgi:hypothetical protein